MSKPTFAASFVLFVAIAAACSGQKGADNSAKATEQSPQPSTVAPDSNTGSAGSAESAGSAGSASSGEAAGSAKGCDASLWKHVYNPSRLQVIDSCMTVSGIIAESDADADGDQHFLLTLDPGQDQLLKKKNAKKKGGNLVVEIVCANPVKLKKARAACPGYVNHVPIPAVGAHVKVTGSFVIDTHNNWSEIHPVSLMEPIK
jgi:hypothetical protein